MAIDIEGGLSGLGAGIEQVGLLQIRAAVEADRDARLSEIRMREEQTVRDRNKADAAAERSRVSEYMKPGIMQANADVAAGAGANDILPGADENVGVDVQNRTRTPTMREAQQRASAAGDLAAMDKFGAEANRAEDNARADKTQAAQERRWKAEDEKWQRTYMETVRHNKAVEANAAEKISPATKAQLEMASTYVSSAHKAESEAAKSLDAARKDPMTSPEKIAALQKDYEVSKAGVRTALDQYNKIGAAHFGDKWKTIETEAPKANDSDVRYDAKGNAYTRGPDGKPVLVTKDAPKPAAGKSGGGIMAKPGDESNEVDWSGELTRSRREHREALDNLAEVKSRLKYLTDSGASEATLRDVRSQLKAAKDEIKKLAFAE